MGMNPCPDETAVIDLSIVRRRIIERLAADGRFCELDARVVEQFDGPVSTISHRLRVRQAFERAMRNGITRRTKDGATQAGIALVTDEEQVTNVIQLPLNGRKNARTGGNGPSAA